MSTSRKTLLALAAVALAQTAVLAYMVIDRIQLLRAGRELFGPFDIRKLREGELDDKEIDIEVSATQAQMEILAPPGMEELTSQIQGMFANLGQGRKRAKKSTALAVLFWFTALAGSTPFGHTSEQYPTAVQLHTPSSALSTAMRCARPPSNTTIRRAASALPP